MPPILNFSADKQGFALDEGECSARGKELAETYQTADPYPHIQMQELIDSDVLRRVVQEFPAPDAAYHAEYRQEKKKYQYTPERIPSQYIRELLNVLNSKPMLRFLEEMTGIDGLIPDPYFLGGGLHETRRGGFLGVHADFNLHKKLRLTRRLNLLIYLNEDWPDEFQGALELWDKQMQRCAVKVPPRLGTSVVFTTDSTSYHGHPDPLECPDDRSRRSIALYYYTASPEGFGEEEYHTTLFRARPQDGRHMEQRSSLRQLLRDLTPPILQRALAKRTASERT